MQHVRTIVLGACFVAGATMVSPGLGTSHRTAQAQGVTRPDSGQVRQKGREHARAWVQGWKALDLTADQQTRIKAIRAKYAPQFAAARNAAKPDLEAARAARQRGDTTAARAALRKAAQSLKSTQALRDQEHAEIRALLTPTQQQQFDSLQLKRKRGAGHGMKGGKYPGNTSTRNRAKQVKPAV